MRLSYRYRLYRWIHWSPGATASTSRFRRTEGEKKDEDSTDKSVTDRLITGVGERVYRLSTEHDRKLCSHCEIRLHARAQKSGRSSVCIAQRPRGWCTILTLSEKARPLYLPVPFYPLTLCFALPRARIPPRGSLTGERRVEETVYGLFAPPPPTLFLRFPVAKSVGPNRLEVGMV